jgi:hypothetical protein
MNISGFSREMQQSWLISGVQRWWNSKSDDRALLDFMILLV